MKYLVAMLAPAAVLVGPLVTMVRADISAEEVRRAIQDGIKFLERQQEPDGHWEDFTGQPGGVTALCTLALLNAGVEADDPKDDHVRARPQARVDAGPGENLYPVAANPGLLPRQSAEVPDPDQEERRLAAKGPASRRAEPRGLVLSRRQRRQLEQPVRPAGALRGPAGRRNRRRQYPHRRPHLATGQGLLGRLPKPRRLLGLQQKRSRHWQHDLRRNHLVDHRRRHGPPGRRQGRRRPDPMLQPGRPGKRPHRAGDELARKKLHRGQKSRRGRRAEISGGSTTSTASNASAGSPPDASSATTIGTARAPTN